jgi:hypothetical protein
MRRDKIEFDMRAGAAVAAEDAACRPATFDTNVPIMQS